MDKLNFKIFILAKKNNNIFAAKIFIKIKKIYFKVNLFISCKILYFSFKDI
jgi:hypothetical protein